MEDRIVQWCVDFNLFLGHSKARGVELYEWLGRWLADHFEIAEEDARILRFFFLFMNISCALFYLVFSIVRVGPVVGIAGVLSQILVINSTPLLLYKYTLPRNSNARYIVTMAAVSIGALIFYATGFSMLVCYEYDETDRPTVSTGCYIRWCFLHACFVVIYYGLMLLLVPLCVLIIKNMARIRSRVSAVLNSKTK